LLHFCLRVSNFFLQQLFFIFRKNVLRVKCSLLQKSWFSMWILGVYVLDILGKDSDKFLNFKFFLEWKWTAPEVSISFSQQTKFDNYVHILFSFSDSHSDPVLLLMVIWRKFILKNCTFNQLIWMKYLALNNLNISMNLK
jgi:hypothetical protein